MLLQHDGSLYIMDTILRNALLIYLFTIIKHISCHFIEMQKKNDKSPEKPFVTHFSALSDAHRVRRAEHISVRLGDFCEIDSVQL